MKCQLLIWLFLIISVFAKELKPRPISYVGGWTIMQMNNLNKHSAHFHYSPSIKYSVGYRVEYWRKKEWQFHGVQANYLIERINTPKSQSNFYLKNGVGLAISNFRNYENKIEPSLFSGISMNWENRRYFTSYENRIMHSFTIDKFFLQKGRIGFAPYIGKYGDLHTWLMLEVQHMPQTKNKMAYTPMLRMFKGDFLAEAGLTNYKEFMLNFIKRF